MVLGFACMFEHFADIQQMQTLFLMGFIHFGSVTITSIISVKKVKYYRSMLLQYCFNKR
jgi:hypothetical protein